MSSTDEIFSLYGIPKSVWGPIMTLESGGDSSAYTLTDREESVGLFQLNRKGGLGSGYSVAQLKDPSLNASIAAGAMAPAYQSGVSQGLGGLDLIRYVAYNSGWPTKAGVGAVNSDPVVSAYDKRLKETVTGTGSSDSSTPGLSTASISKDSTLAKILFVALGGGVILLGLRTMTEIGGESQ